MKGYGLLIAQARESAGLDVADLAERIGKSVTTVRRLESEETEPSVEHINALVSALPISAETLLQATPTTTTAPTAPRLAHVPLGGNYREVAKRLRGPDATKPPQGGLCRALATWRFSRKQLQYSRSRPEERLLHPATE